MSEDMNVDAGMTAGADSGAGAVQENVADVLFGGQEGQGQEQAASQAQTQEGQPQPSNGADIVPEDGVYNLTMPEGIPLDEDVMNALAPEFKELGLTVAQAQKLADKYIEVQKARLGEQEGRWGEVIAGWAQEAKADKEIGGAKWDATVAAGRLAVEKFGTAELRNYLNESGAGNHVEIIRFMAKIGSMLGEDNPPQGGLAMGGQPKEAAHLLFSNDVA